MDGSIIGNIKVSGKLVVGQNGTIEGEVECKNASIAGSLKGTLKVAQSMSLSATADIEGDVHTEKLSIEPGASINGAVSMGTVMKKVEVSVNESSKQPNKTRYCITKEALKWIKNSCVLALWVFKWVL